MADEKKPGIFQKILDAGNAYLDSQILKAKADAEEEIIFSKAVKEDPSHIIGAQGYKDRNGKLNYDFFKHMSIKDVIVAAIIQTQQNRVAAHSKPVHQGHEKGFRIKLKNEGKALEEIKEELRGKQGQTQSKDAETRASQNQDRATSGEAAPKLEGDTDLDGMIDDRELTRLAKDELHKRHKEKIQAIEEFLCTCGEMDKRRFQDKKWNLETFLKAIVRDSLTYDQYAVEKVRDRGDKLSYFVPVDGGSIRFASQQLRNYKQFPLLPNPDILYPEKELKRGTVQETIELDDEKLENDEYKYVQVVKGKIERAFTDEELCVGMRNPVTDIYSNGYSLPELEILVSIVSSHIFTEHYNKSYFEQGFSAKGILHIKTPLNRRKLETIRHQWQHMLKGSRNSFQTPIMAGMDEVDWIPLTQNHSDMEFSNWMNYLIKAICAIYQIDPIEIGFPIKDAGGTSGLNGDNSEEKISLSINKGLVPLMRHVEQFINDNIVSDVDANYKFEFVGIKDESVRETLERQEKEIKFKKTLNEIREEDGLPPIEGCDDLILEPTYMQWFSQFHPDAKRAMEAMQGQGGFGEDPNQEPDQEGDPSAEQLLDEDGDGTLDELRTPDEETADSALENVQDEEVEKSLKKSVPIKIEYYSLGSEDGED